MKNKHKGIRNLRMIYTYHLTSISKRYVDRNLLWIDDLDMRTPHQQQIGTPSWVRKGVQLLS